MGKTRRNAIVHGVNKALEDVSESSSSSQAVISEELQSENRIGYKIRQVNSNRAADSSREFMKYTSMAFQMIGSILAFVFMGYFIDNSWAKHHFGFPVFTIVGTLLGVAASLYLILKKI